MSLMNDALRKKKREGVAPPSDDGVVHAVRRPRPVRRWILAVAALLLGGILLGGVCLQQAADSGSLRINDPLPASARPVPSLPADEFPDDGRPVASAAVPEPVAGSPNAPIDGPAAAPVARLAPPPTLEPSGGSTTVAPAGTPAPAAATEVESPGVEPAEADGGASPRAAARPGEGPRSVERDVEPGPLASVDRRPAAAAAPVPKRSAADRPQATDGRTDRRAVEAASAADPFYRKALACHRTGRLTEAARLYRQVLMVDRDHAQAMFNLAAVYLQQGGYDEARSLLERLEHAGPRPAGVLLNLAVAAIGRGDPQTALAYLDRADAQADAAPWEIRFHRAAALSRMGRQDDSLALYRQVAGERPDDGRVRFNLAVTCDHLGLYRDALAHYQAALQVPAQFSADERPAIIDRVATIRRYLDTLPSPGKGQ